MEIVCKNKENRIETLSADIGIVLQHVRSDDIILQRDYNNLNQANCTGAEFVDKHRNQLIQRVSSVIELADSLLGKKIITYELYSQVCAAATSQQQMRILYTSLHSGGKMVKEEFYNLLKETHPLLVADLEG